MFEQLTNVLDRRKKNSEVIYIPNVGNAGDAFIAHATYQFFRRLGVSYKIGSLAGTYPGATVVCAGGGALIEPYVHIADFLTRNLNKWQELIILPHTIQSYGPLLSQLRDTSYLFCREKSSFAYAKLHAAHANTYLSHDIAFSCQFSETEKQLAIRTQRDVAMFIINLRSNVALLRKLRTDLRRIPALLTPFTLNAFRSDLERTKIVLPEDNVDVAEIFSGHTMPPILSCHATYRMQYFLKHFRVIRTNRLHLAIMSAMLGLEVHFYDNSYGKCRDVYYHSIQDRYPNVYWHADSQP